MKIAFVTSYFNPCGWKSRANNYFEFLRNWPRHIPLLTVQHGGTKLHQDVKYFSNGEPFIWQKERLLNLGAWDLTYYDYIGYVDADIILNQGWEIRLQQLIDTWPVIRLFTSPASQGYGWVFRRDFWVNVGLYERCVIGGGDRYMYNGLVGQKLPRTITYLKEDYTNWCKKAFEYSKGVFVAVGGNTVKALNHGSMVDRCYDSRHGSIESFHSELHVQTIVNGPLIWSPQCPASIKDTVRAYFNNRNEDNDERTGCRRASDCGT